MRMISALAAFLLCVTPAEAQDRTFGDNECTDDCSGHKAGYEWAERNSVSREADCLGQSNSFEEGCRTFIEDPYRGADEDDQGDPIE